MDQRENLRKHIREFLDRPECADEVRNNAVDVSWCVMEALDSWIEEQPDESARKFEIGDKVRMVTHNPDEEEDDGPILPAYGVVSGYHMGLADPHYLVNFEKEFDQQHDGLEQAEDDHGNLVETNHGWFCHQDVLEKV